MKQLWLLLLICGPIWAQYDEQWEKVYAFEEAGKTKSADAVVNEILSRAKKSQNEPEILRGFFYHNRFLYTLSKNAQRTILEEVAKPPTGLSVPSEAIMLVIQAEILQQYYKQHYWQIDHRKETNQMSDTPLTWTGKNFEAAIQARLDNSLKNRDKLSRTPASEYRQLFDFRYGEDPKKLSLLECLLREHAELDLAADRPVKQKLLLSSNLFGDATQFTAEGLSTGNPEVDRVITRLQEIERLTPSERNRFERLIRLEQLLGGDFRLDLALSRFNATDPSVRQELLFRQYKKLTSSGSPSRNIEALKILDSILSIPEKSNVYWKSTVEKKTLHEREFTVTSNSTVTAGRQTRVLIGYRNLAGVDVSVFTINRKQAALWRESSTKQDSLGAALAKKRITAFHVDFVKERRDYLPHKTEILLPALETGQYLLAFSPTDQAGTTDERRYTAITATHLMPLVRELNDRNYIQVVDRESGRPVSGVSLKNAVATAVTDRDGEAVLAITKENSLRLAKTGDSLDVNRSYSHFYNYSSSGVSLEAKARIYFDRAIYRPGQRVWYKVIVMKEKNAEQDVVPKVHISILLENEDGDEIEKKVVLTNDFGSASGFFDLPKTAATGTYSLTVDKPTDDEDNFLGEVPRSEYSFWHTANWHEEEEKFQVEEYKRPRFEVVMDPFEKALRPGDSVHISGRLQAFDGSSLSNAEVRFAIHRTEADEYYDPEDDEPALISGNIRSGAEGKFNFAFVALPDPEENANNVYKYHIKIEATDNSGETHGATTSVKAGNRKREVSLYAPWRCDTSRRNKFAISTQNLNGGFVPTKGIVRLFRQSVVKEAYMPRPWAKPDRPVIDSLTYKQLFPFEKELGDKGKWTTDGLNSVGDNGELMATLRVDTAVQKEWSLDMIDLYPSGDYRIEFTTDEENGQVEKSTYNFQIKQHRDPFDKSKIITLTTKEVSPGTKEVIVQLASPIDGLYVRIAGFYDGAQFFQEDVVLDNGKAKVRLPILPAFKDGIMISAETVYKDHFFVESLPLTIPTQEKKVSFEVKTFRNRIVPGQKEQWQFSLSDPETEVLASMYDRSLDTFIEKTWELPTIRHYFGRYFTQRLAQAGNIGELSFRQLNEWSPQPVYRQEKPGLIWFGFSINNDWFDRNAYKAMLQRKAPSPANSRRITGIVVDENNEAISWVSIFVKGSRRATLSNLDGSFEIEAAPEETLQFISSGMLDVETKVGNETLTIRMKSQPGHLKEVVVEGFAVTRTKAYCNAATTTVSSVTYEYETTSSFLSKLQSQVAGLNIANGRPGANTTVIVRGVGSISVETEPLYVVDGITLSRDAFLALDPASVSSVSTLKAASATAVYGNRAAHGVIVVTTKKAVADLVSVTPRRNLSETAFFFPHLQTDKNGALTFSFETPEALTEWMFRMLAHTKKMASGLFLGTVRTQKDLMVAPNFPRFLRENDRVTVKVRVSNLTPEPKTGTIRLSLTDEQSGADQNHEMGIGDGSQPFSAPPMGTVTVSWTLAVPEGVPALRYNIVAKAGDFSDGEENLIPVLTNAMLVTESQPLWVREGSSQKITLPTLATPSCNRRPHLLTIEYTSNPAWSALQSLPYLMEFEHECSEQLFSRFYSQQLARRIIESNPRIAEVFAKWANPDSTEAQNDDLHRLIAAETPWADDLKSESEKKKHLASLFGKSRLESESASTLGKISERQLPSGGFSWFGGETENPFITRHIIGGLGHLLKLEALDTLNEKVQDILERGIDYLDEEVQTHNMSDKKGGWRDRSGDLHYLYVRSFFKHYPLPDAIQRQLPALLTDVRQHWLDYSLYEKGMAALVAFRWGDKTLAKTIIDHLRETEVNDTTEGIYWNTNVGGWYWNQSPIETQSLLIEAFDEIARDNKTVEGMKVWLLAQRSRSHWPTTKASTEAIYALLLQGRDWLSVEDKTVIKAGDPKVLQQKQKEHKEEAGTGYMNLQWKPSEITPELSQIEIRNDARVPGYGGVFWQYFERMEKVQTGAPTGLSVVKQLFYKPISGPAQELKETNLRIGDRVLIRLIVTAEHDFEFVHLKDLRASCLEPVDVLSSYGWLQGASFYKTTRDAATHYFFENLPKGTYVLEYEVKVNNAGDFSSGPATVESMYAPAFSGRSSGGRIETQE